MNKILQVDVSELLHKANREIKSLNYKLLRVVANEDFHVNLYPNKFNDMELIENTPVVYKLLLKGMASPAKFTVSFKEDNQKNDKKHKNKLVDLKVWMSLVHKEPGEKHHQKAIIG